MICKKKLCLFIFQSLMGRNSFFLIYNQRIFISFYFNFGLQNSLSIAYSINIIHFFSRMRSQSQQGMPKKQFKEVCGDDSDDSEEFQELEDIEEPKVSSSNHQLKITTTKNKEMDQKTNSQNQGIKKLEALKSELTRAKESLGSSQERIKFLQKCNQSLKGAIREKQLKLYECRQAIEQKDRQIAKNQQIIKKAQQKIVILVKENTQNSIKAKSAQERAVLENKVNREVFANLKKNMQRIHGNLTENRIDKILLLLQQQNSFVTQISQKTNQIFYQVYHSQNRKSDHIKDKTNNRIDLGQVFYRLQKIQASVYKVQSQVTAHREYIGRLEKQLQNLKESPNNGGLKKWFDPVMKLCKFEQQTTPKNIDEKIIKTQSKTAVRVPQGKRLITSPNKKIKETDEKKR